MQNGITKNDWWFDSNQYHKYFMSNYLQLQFQTFSFAISFHAFKYKFYLISVQEYIYVATTPKIQKPQKASGTYQI